MVKILKQSVVEPLHFYLLDLASKKLSDNFVSIGFTEHGKQYTTPNSVKITLDTNKRNEELSL